MIRKVGARRVRVTAERGFAEVAWCAGLTELRVAFVRRVNKSPQGWIGGVGRQLTTLRFAGHTRRHALGRLLYGADSPPPLWSTLSRQRAAQGTWGRWYWVAHRP